MSMSDCKGCWETPCICDDARGYRHLSTNELIRVRNGINLLINKREKDDPDGDLRARHGQ